MLSTYWASVNVYWLAESVGKAVAQNIPTVIPWTGFCYRRRFHWGSKGTHHTTVSWEKAQCDLGHQQLLNILKNILKFTQIITCPKQEFSALSYPKQESFHTQRSYFSKPYFFPFSLFVWRTSYEVEKGINLFQNCCLTGGKIIQSKTRLFYVAEWRKGPNRERRCKPFHPLLGFR